MSDVNWSKLVAQNRVKAPGIPWTPAESKALKEGIAPDDVRLGIITKEDLDKVNAEEAITGTKLIRMNKEKLIALAKDLEIEFSEVDVKRSDLISVISTEIKRIKAEEEKLEQEKSKENTL
jgi:hypothetical protein